MKHKMVTFILSIISFSFLLGACSKPYNNTGKANVKIGASEYFSEEEIELAIDAIA